MSVSRVKTWLAAEILTASDLNAEFNNLINNALSLISPLTGALDFNGKELILDADADSSLTMDTDDRLDLRLQGVDLFRWLGTVASAVNGLDFIAAAAGSEPSITARGSDTDINVNAVPKGAGLFTVAGVPAVKVYDFTDTGDTAITGVTGTTGITWSSSQSIIIPTSGLILIIPYARIDNASGGSRDYSFGLDINSTDYWAQMDDNGSPEFLRSEAIETGTYATFQGFMGLSNAFPAIFVLDIVGHGISTGSQTVQPIVGTEDATTTQTLKGTTVTARCKVVVVAFA